MQGRYLNLESLSLLWIDYLSECQPSRSRFPIGAASIHFKALRSCVSLKVMLQQRCSGSGSQKEHFSQYESSATVSVSAHAAWWKRSKNSHYHIKALAKITWMWGRETERRSENTMAQPTQPSADPVLDPNISHRYNTGDSLLVYV